MSPRKDAKQVQLSNEELREISRLTGEVTDALQRMSHIVLGRLDKRDEKCGEFAVVLPTNDNPLQIAFGKARESGKAKENTALIEAEDDISIGYYIDPPGICTDVPACVAY